MDAGCDIILDSILNMDCMDGLKQIPDKSVDLIVMDPPYSFARTEGAGAYGKSRPYFKELKTLAEGITNDFLDVLLAKEKSVNIYIWCNKAQLRQYFDYFEDRGCFTDLLTWHKTNPIPTCCNKYLSDTEYLFFAKGKGVKIYGSYETKRKWYVSDLNTSDKKKYSHPTIKPLEIIKNLIINSSLEGQTVLDPFMGSGTTAVACKQTGRHFIGFEIDPEYYQTAMRRLRESETGKWF